MKIEIEADDLFYLKEKIKKQEKEIQNLETEIKDLGKDRLKKIVIYNSFKLANKYLAAIFNKLGFDNKQDDYYNDTLKTECNFTHWVGEDWYVKDDKVIVAVSVDITEQFRKVFLRLGVVDTQKDEKKELDFLKELE